MGLDRGNGVVVHASNTMLRLLLEACSLGIAMLFGESHDALWKLPCCLGIASSCCLEIAMRFTNCIIVVTGRVKRHTEWQTHRRAPSCR